MESVTPPPAAPHNRARLFDYKALRLLVALLALAIPIATSAVSGQQLASISASYYTGARDVFVGLSFAIAALFFAYNGHPPDPGKFALEKWAAKLAAVATVVVALVPTRCAGCQPNLQGHIHYAAAATVFIVLAYFCFGPFRHTTRGQRGGKGRRDKVYLACGAVMVLCMLAIGLAPLVFGDDQADIFQVTRWGETISLFAFSFAWLVAAKVLRPFVDADDDKLRLFRRKGEPAEEPPALAPI